MNKPPVTVLGAGIQGVSAALALATRGHRVTLLDAAPEPMLAASLQNEGKIHLGLVYARDESFRTAKLMLEAALRFGPLVERWLEQPVDWGSLSSQPFRYVIARDSMVSAPDLLAFYDRLQSHYQELLAYPGAHYLGKRHHRLWTSAGACPGVCPGFSEESVSTCEVAVDLSGLRRLLIARLRTHELITLLCGHQVSSIERQPGGFRVRGVRADSSPFSLNTPVVANCTWTGRLALDAQLGIAPDRPWVYRLKCGLLGEMPSALAGVPSITFVLGPFGDLVHYPSGPSYFSWYPTCLRGWSSDVEPPVHWGEYIGGCVRPDLREDLERSTLAALDGIIPGFHASRVTDVKAGVIFSWGDTDIDDFHSELHERHQVGVMAYDGYFTVDPGKFTCGPYFGERLAETLA